MRLPVLLVTATVIALGVAACGGESQTSITSDITDTNITTGGVASDDMEGSSAAASAAGAGTIAPPVSGQDGASVDTTGGATGNQLTGKVGPGRSITLTKGGEDVSRLPAGTYQLTVTDASNVENFTLVDPNDRADVITKGAEQGTKTVTVDLTAGNWVFMSQPSAKYARGDFTVE